MTDNYYTTVKVAIHMWVKYGWTIVGTIVGTDKVTRGHGDWREGMEEIYLKGDWST